MRKADLKKKLIDSFKLEESVVRIYTEILSSVLTTYLDKKDLEEAQEILQVMIRNSEHHRNTCQNLLSQLDLDTRNDY